jgi:hypothetical protein
MARRSEASRTTWRCGAVATTVTDSITCPNCGCQIPLTDAIEHQVEERFRAQLATELAQRDADQERELAAREKALRREFAEVQETREAELAQRAAARVATELDDLKGQLEERDGELKEARKRELEFRKQKRELEEAQEELELEVARRIDSERKQLVARETERLQEAHRLQLRERDQQLEQMKSQIDDLKRSAEPTQAGLRGEALEREIEDVLRDHFPDDLFTPVKAGVRGADIVQSVRVSGNEVGTILWESKRAASWSKTWVPKLKGDQATAKADIAAIVTTALPPDVQYMDHRDGVWVVETVCVVAAAEALRSGLIDVAQARNADKTRSEALAVLHDYLCGREFRARFEPIVETIIEMKVDLDKERRGLERFWAKRDKEIERLARAAVGIYGDLQGILGQALPTVSKLELPK